MSTIESDSFNGLPTVLKEPRCGCGTSTIMSRACRWSSANRSALSSTGPQGTSMAFKRSITSNLV